MFDRSAPLNKSVIGNDSVYTHARQGNGTHKPHVPCWSEPRTNYSCVREETKNS